MTLFVGLTGGIACGKSTVLNELGRLGAAIFSADECVHSLLSSKGEVRDQIAAAFGEDVIGSDGWPDRAKLASAVFPDAALRSTLEEIVHPEVKRSFLEWKESVAGAGAEIAVAEIPLLFESAYDWGFDVTVAVVSEHRIQLSRLLSKGFSRLDAESRIAVQMSPERKAELATIVIYNNGTPSQLQSQVKSLWEELQVRLSKTRQDMSP